MLNLETATRKDILALPKRATWEADGTVYNMVLVVPSRTKHDSGWAGITLIGINKEVQEICTTYSDDISWKNPLGLEIRTDCFFKSKVLQFWSSNANFLIGSELSSVNIEIIKQ